MTHFVDGIYDHGCIFPPELQRDFSILLVVDEFGHLFVIYGFGVLGIETLPLLKKGLFCVDGLLIMTRRRRGTKITWIEKLIAAAARGHRSQQRRSRKIVEGLIAKIAISTVVFYPQSIRKHQKGVRCWLEGDRRNI